VSRLDIELMLVGWWYINSVAASLSYRDDVPQTHGCLLPSSAAVSCCGTILLRERISTTDTRESEDA
jgi:hypothetical protein